ncbi:hypothetical protein JCM10914A_53850 [Paenibacillus sp. JCM 10914]|uniref:S-layer homology domain-containing protein n=1 Tax=Paenibacillus sp. JCM 10914 TaxID=1236974 RepID=UPI0003CC9BF2|nr:S-layer homology domain-containing protein [Paenibacillus sp. JCM 10914]GAE04884.1 5'-nucleotidase domain protein [Paenibacillus sp. JCM 10914]
MKKTTKMLTALLVTSSLLGAGAASAFTDVKEEQPLRMVKELQSKGIVNGISVDRFAPNQAITTAQAIKMIVQATGLEEQPNFSGRSFDSVPQGAWYAKAVNIAVQNELSVTSDMKWNDPITREDFATLLSEAIQQTGNYPVVMMYIHVADEEDMKEESRGAVQFLLLTKIASLNASNEFDPLRSLTRLEAAELVYNSIEFIEEHQKNTVPAEPEQSEPGVTTSVVKVDDEQNKVTVTKEDLPHPGYGIDITSVDYVSDTEAVIYYKIVQPDPDKMYPQVISSSSDDVLVPAKYTKITVKSAGTLEFKK